MCGEVGPRTAESSHAFSGDHRRGLLTGELRPFARSPEDSPNLVSFGSLHPSIIQFCMVDGSVQTFEKGIDPAIVDRMASRTGDDPYDVSGTATSCHTAHSPPGYPF